MELVKAPTQRLRIQTNPVKKITPALLKTLKEMIKLTKTFKDPEGVGLASTQVGLDESFFVAKDGEKFISIINPKILKTGKRTKTYFEGCLSIPGTWGQVKRFTYIKAQYQDESGKVHTQLLKGVLAWIFQHEVDHLNGMLFTQRVLGQGGKFYKYRGKDPSGAETYEEITI